MRYFIFFLLVFICSGACAQSDAIRFNFEGNKEGWEIPDWALNQGDHVGRKALVSPDKSSSGENALEVTCDFPGDAWRAVIVDYETNGDLDLSGYKSISADIYLPKKAQGTLYQARIIVTAGPWYFLEMSRPVDLKQGEWTKVEAKLDVDETDQRRYWKYRKDEEGLLPNIDKVKRIAIRIEYNASPSMGGPPYKGPIYIDNVVIE